MLCADREGGRFRPYRHGFGEEPSIVCAARASSDIGLHAEVASGGPFVALDLVLRENASDAVKQLAQQVQEQCKDWPRS